MSEPVDSRVLVTLDSLAGDLRACGLRAGQTVLVHMAMGKLGYVVGGAETVIMALLHVLGAEGTLMMPTHTSENSEPSNWRHPPVPESWWPVIRANAPAYNPATTPTRMMGRVAELFRTWPGAIRSAHPHGSFAALGPNAQILVGNHTLEDEFGPTSPIGQLYNLGGYVLLLGVDHGNNTSLHMAEERAHWPSKHTVREGTAMLVDGERRWVEYDAHDYHDEDFPQLGDAYEAEHGIRRCRVGGAEARFMLQAPLVDFGVRWLEANRQ